MSRSDIMRAVKRAHTAPEIVVRQALHALGLRFRLHRRDLPGSPDIVLPKFRTVVFVHGCFWHRHPDCRYATTPKSRQEYWLPKFEANVGRDARKEAQLRDLGWRVVVMWECETKSFEALEARLRLEFDLPLGESIRSP
ncbi:very short patch repair endonuclease [Pseudomonas sp. PA-1-3F]|uniref:very short patch repair endonuclease n=1 Tax=Pseudomonas sp. PA-1-3F TaxID=2665465 RepID=UPI001F2E9D43|nr:very short patch repair endonuclease [Pseudomonas sp. PA-1-3F]MCF5686490.1 DNA mismatch endonuclease Vsr [Pseudomonas sp. PA-1-3F]